MEKKNKLVVHLKNMKFNSFEKNKRFSLKTFYLPKIVFTGLSVVVIFFSVSLCMLISGCEIYREIYQEVKVERHINKLQDKNPKVRVNAAVALGRIGSVDAVPTLIQALQDENPMVRAASASTLGNTGEKSKDAEPALIQLLQDQDVFVRVSAARALGQIGTPEAIKGVEDAVPSLIQELQDHDKWVLRNAARALGYVGKAAKDAVPALIRLLQDQDKFVRTNAARALKQIGTPDAIKAVDKVL